MRIENPTFALTPDPPDASAATASPSPDVTQTVAPTAPDVTADKAGLVDGAGDSDVVYIRGWRLRKTRIWQALTALCLGLFLVMVVTFASWTDNQPAVVAPTPTPTAAPQVTPQRECQQPDCVYQAADIVRLMNMSADPCDDFYNYACGNFEDMAPHSRNTRSVFSVPDWLRTKNEERVVELLEDKPDIYSPESSLWKLKTLYSTCLDDFANMRGAGKKMVKLIDALGGLDLWGTWNEDLWRFNATFRKVHDEHWTDVMMNFFWVRNPADPRHNLLRITKSGLGIPYPHAYLSPSVTPYEDMIDSYQMVMSNVMDMLVRDSGVNTTALNRSCEGNCVQDFIDDVMDIETKLANITVTASPFRRRAIYPRATGLWSFGRRRSRRYLPFSIRLRRFSATLRITLGDLTRMAPQIDWIGLFEDLMGSNVISASTRVEIPRDGYVAKLGRLIERESKRALHHYLVWSMIRRHLMGMSADYVFQKIQLDEAMRRGRRPLTRPEYCRSVLDKHMSEAVGMLFVKDHTGLSTLKQTANFTQQMVAAYNSSFRSWMTDSVIYHADSILKNITFHYGFPKWILDERELDSYFEPLAIVSDNFFQNIKNIDLFKRVVLRNKLKYGNSKQRWTIKATHARILSSTSGAYLAVPAGMIQTPVYTPSLPSYISTAALGTLLGEHLATFTVTNNETKLLDRVWWDSATYGRYRPYRSCLLDLYRNHTLQSATNYLNAAEIPLRPERQAASIVGRHYSLDVAFREHRRILEKTGTPVRLPGLQHETSDQTFFLAFAQARCSTKRSSTTDYLLHRLAGIIPRKLEVNSAVYNHPSFRTAYKCRAVPAVYDHAPCAVLPIESPSGQPQDRRP